jgi:hypothetical protein
MDTIQEPILILDESYRIVDANEPVCNKFKCDTENIIGKHCYEVQHNLDRPCFEKGLPCPVKIALETGQQARVLHEHLQSDNTIVWEDMLASPLKDKNGNISLIIEEVRDITKLFQSKEIKRHFNNGIKEKRSFLPICASCKKIRNDKGDWECIEEYIYGHSNSDLTHTICSECHKKLYSDF